MQFIYYEVNIFIEEDITYSMECLLSRQVFPVEIVSSKSQVGWEG